MNSSFRAVVAEYKRPSTLTHAQRVTRLYRAALRTADSWACDRNLFIEEGRKIRQQFDDNKALDPASGLTQRLVREGEDKLKDWIHPDPYTNPYMPGGSRFMRNPPPPLSAVFSKQASIPLEYTIAAQDVHYVQVPMSSTPEGMSTVFIDPMRKRAE